MDRTRGSSTRSETAIGPLSSWALAVVGLAIAVALFLPALTAPAAFAPAGPAGSLQTVTLTNGQVYFGKLKSVERTGIVLTGVYYALTTTDPQTQQRTTKLVSRQAADWHGPVDMAIPLDRI